MSTEEFDKFKKYESLANIGLKSNTTVCIRADGKNFSKLLKSLGPIDDDHHEAMVLSAIETIKLMSNFIIAHVQSDEISFILSNEDNKDTQPWFGNRLQKMISVTAGSVSSVYSILMSSYKEKLLRGVFDARLLELGKEEIAEYITYRIRSGYNNTISKVYSVEIGHNISANLAIMDRTLKDLQIVIPDKHKYGTIIIKKDGEFVRLDPREYLSELDDLITAIFEEIAIKKIKRENNENKTRAIIRVSD